MADNFPCEIEIGGELSLEQIEKIVEICKTNGGTLDYGYRPVNVEEIISMVESDNKLLIVDSDARYGEMPALESYLIDQQIPFIEHHDGRYEFDAIKVWFNGEESISFDSNQSKDLLVQAYIVRDAIAMIESGKIEEGVEMLRSRTIEPNLPPVSFLKDTKKERDVSIDDIAKTANPELGLKDAVTAVLVSTPNQKLGV